jgi:Putative prokaryotic signal transducing protein
MTNLDSIVVVRTYANEAEASIAASRLGSEGIEAHIQKDDCGGAYPALQMSGGVRLLVNHEDLEDAEKILNAMQVEDSGEVEQPEQQENCKRPKSSPILLIGLFLLGLAAGYFLSPELTNRSTYTGVIRRDRNGDGKPGTIYHYVDGQLARVEEDRNYDGKPDAWLKYVTDKLRTGEYDNNFDGKPDVWATYKDRFNFVEKYDTDFDGKPDATNFYVNGLKQRVDWHPNDSAIIVRREFYEHGLLKEALVDTDGDGIFDQRITYDRYERPIGKAKCWVTN